MKESEELNSQVRKAEKRGGKRSNAGRPNLKTVKLTIYVPLAIIEANGGPLNSRKKAKNALLEP